MFFIVYLGGIITIEVKEVNVTQQTLKEIKRNLNSSFSTFSTEASVEDFVKAQMKNHWIYTKERCNTILNEAINYLEKRINEKYNEIAKLINEYIDVVNECIKETGVFQSSTKSDLTNLAIGAGTGLGLALVLGGPIGWLVGIGIGAAALFNSSNKKRQLIDQIRMTADHLNKEAITKLTKVLNTYIIPEPILLGYSKTYQRIEKQADSAFLKSLTREQREIKDFLEKRGIEYLVHFTAMENKDKIETYGLLSHNKAKVLKVNIPRNDNGKTANKPKQIMEIQMDDYISLSVTQKNDSLLNAYISSNRIGNEILVYYIDANILWREINTSRIYCNMNASSRSVELGDDLKALKAMFADNINQEKNTVVGLRLFPYSRIGLKDNQTTHPQAEILFYGVIAPKYIVRYDYIKIEEGEN